MCVLRVYAICTKGANGHGRTLCTSSIDDLLRCTYVTLVCVACTSEITRYIGVRLGWICSYKMSKVCSARAYDLYGFTRRVLALLVNWACVTCAYEMLVYVGV